MSLNVSAPSGGTKGGGLKFLMKSDVVSMLTHSSSLLIWAIDMC